MTELTWAIVVIGVLSLLLFLGVFALYMEHRRKPDSHGFEVKLNTGEEPVIKKERDIDHG